MTRHGTTIETMAPSRTGRFAGTPLDEAAPEEGLLFNALLFPNRSLSHKGFWAVLGIVITVNIVSAIFYSRLGAWPVTIFCLVDIFIVWVAFRISYRQGRLHERVRLAPEHLTVSRVLPSGHESRWELQPFWTRIEIDDPVRHESQLRLISHGKVLVIGAFLAPKERGELARALQTALGKARQGT